MEQHYRRLKCHLKWKFNVRKENMKLLSLFSGIGAFEKALDKLNIKYELVNYCEIDKYAAKSYALIHNESESKNLGDITKVDTSKLPNDIDLVTYGFPCQDISLAGKQKGMFNEDGTKTRSGLFFEALRIIEDTKPRVAIAENVKNLVSKKFNAQFQTVLESLEQAGYNNYYQILNAKDYGIPQNRERVFIVSIRKDIDTGLFKFPEGFPLELRLKDLLEEEVDEKYYIDKDFVSVKTHGNVVGMVSMKGNECVRRIYDTEKEAPALTTMEGGHRQPKIFVEPTIQRIDIPQTVKVRKYPVDTDALCEVLRHHKALADQNNNGISNALGVPVTKVEHWFRRDDCFAIPDPDVWFRLKELLEITTDEFDESIMTFEERLGTYEKSERVYDADGIAATVTRTDADMKVLVKEATKLGYAEAVVDDSINLEQPNSKTRRGRVGHGVAQTLTTLPQQAVVCEPKIEVVGNYSPSGHDASRIVSGEGIAPTVKENHGTVTAVTLDEPQLRIRKLTPKECFRLMGFDDEDFEKAAKVISNTQLYKQAGNSIVVNALEHLLTNLYKSTEQESKKPVQMNLYNYIKDAI